MTPNPSPPTSADTPPPSEPSKPVSTPAPAAVVPAPPPPAPAPRGEAEAAADAQGAALAAAVENVTADFFMGLEELKAGAAEQLMLLVTDCQGLLLEADRTAEITGASSRFPSRC